MLQIKALGKVGLYMSATEVHTSVLDSMPFSAFKRLLDVVILQHPLMTCLVLGLLMLGLCCCRRTSLSCKR